MTCMTMLDRMLEADLSELSGRGDSVVAVHVRECVRCRRVAERLVADTRELANVALPAAAAAKPKTISRSPRRRYVIAAAIAATIVAVVARDRASKPPARVVTPLVMQPVEIAPSLVRGGAIPPDRPVAPRRRAAVRIRNAAQPTGRPIEATQVRAERTVAPVSERAVAVLPVRLVPAAQPSLGDTVSVEPVAGKRVSVIRTDRPGMTIVWLYE